MLAALLVITVAACLLTQWFLSLDDGNSVALQLSEAFDEVAGVKPATKPPRSILWDQMDYGPFFSSSFGGSKNPVTKGISIRVGAKQDAAICFDTELLRVRAGWTGDFLKLPRFRGGLEGEPKPAGNLLFQTLHRFGWGLNRQTTSSEQKTKYRGLFSHGRRVILSYEINDVPVLETPWFYRVNDFPIFVRTFELGPTTKPLAIHLCDIANGKGMSVDGLPVLLQETPTNATFTVARSVGLPAPAEWTTSQNEGITLLLPALSQRTTFSVFLSSGPKQKLSSTIASLPQAVETDNLHALCFGGPLLWKETVTTTAKVASPKNGYQVETIGLPEKNPWGSWVRPGGFDFFEDGRIALCSLSGDVWIASGIGEHIETVTWKRFATGLFQPLGLKIVKGEIFVICRDALIRLNDLNKDGEADFYESVNRDIANGAHFHEFCLDLQTDKEGNFYTLKGSNLNASTRPQQGTLLKISPDGGKLEIIANGFRAPNGLSITPTGEIFATDNEGDWIPNCKLNRIEKGKFYGFTPTSYTEKVPANFEPPVVWLPHIIDNSSGAPVWVESKKWGPFEDHLLHTSYGTCALFAVLKESVNDQWQGGVVQFPLKFDSGIMRGRFSPFDGQLYLCGLNGWQSKAAKDGGFYRVRFTGESVHMPVELHVRPDEIELRFTDALDLKSATDPENFSIEEWNYKWTSKYGSEEFSAKSNGLLGHDKKEIESCWLSADGKSVFLSIPHLKPVMQMKIEYNIDAADGFSMHQEIYNTINAVPTNTAALHQ